MAKTRIIMARVAGVNIYFPPFSWQSIFDFPPVHPLSGASFRKGISCSQFYDNLFWQQSETRIFYLLNKIILLSFVGTSYLSQSRIKKEYCTERAALLFTGQSVYTSSPYATAFFFSCHALNKGYRMDSAIRTISPTQMGRPR